MDFSPLLDSTPAIISHTIVAMLMVALGAVQLALPKGTPVHRASGYVWVAGLAFVAISGFFIHELRVWGAFSPIHLLSVLALVGIVRAVHFARQGKIEQHKRVMLLLYFLALIVTGIFTFLPGRIMYQIFIGG